jgi:hypothetical protein
MKTHLLLSQRQAGVLCSRSTHMLRLSLPHAHHDRKSRSVAAASRAPSITGDLALDLPRPGALGAPITTGNLAPAPPRPGVLMNRPPQKGTRVSKLSRSSTRRHLSNSGRLFFNSDDALVPADSNGTQDVYQYEPPGVANCTEANPTFGARSGGCVDLISAGTSGEESAFLDASESGDDVFFLTRSRLVAQDIDAALDVYDAHVCTAEVPCLPEPAPPAPECSGDSCQQPAVPPNDATPGSLTFNGAGNVLQCPKGKVKNSGACVKRKSKVAKKHKHPKRHSRSRKRAGR